MSQGSPFQQPSWQQPNAFAPQGYPGQQYPNQFGQQPPKSGGGKLLLIILGALGSGVVLTFLVCCGTLAWIGQRPTATAAAKQPFNLAAVPVPAFPERGAPQELEPGVDLYTIPINGQTGGHYTTPGHGGKIYVYLPQGTHAPGSLPCVLITGAGTDMMTGYEFDELGDFGDGAEHIPYVKAGFAVVAYELDGSGYNENTTEKDDYNDFKASCAGMVNARNALEFTLQKIPEVNPAKIFSAGHSSAGTAALLFAAHEPRLAGCVAYAPCSDVENFQPAFLIRMLSSERPGLVDFLCQSSPKTHHTRIKCPVLLFHAEDDTTVEIKTSREFEKLLKQHNPNVTLQTVPTGEHYDSMIEQGIPAGIEWMKSR